MKTALIGGMAVAAVITFAAPANADMQGYQDFERTANAGDYDPGGNYGLQVCAALRGGASMMSQIGRLEGLMGRAQANNIATGAHQYLCPEV